MTTLVVEPKSQPLTLDAVIEGAAARFREHLETNEPEKKPDQAMREIADGAVPGNNLVLLEVVQSDPTLLYDEDERGLSTGREILGAAIMDRVLERLDDDWDEWVEERAEAAEVAEFEAEGAEEK